MLVELYRYWTTPVPKHLRALGFLKESLAMDARYRRCRNHWDTHYQHCRAAILQAVEGVEAKGTSKGIAVILGAGSLRDVPLEVLCERFEQVVLVDLLFLKEARKRASHYPNAVLVEADVTGLLEPFFSHQHSTLSPNLSWSLPSLHELIPFPNSRIDFIVSLNLITQLPIIPVSQRLKKENADNALLNDMAKRLVTDHLALLDQCEGVRCLIADREVNEYDRQMVRMDGFNPAWDVALPECEQTWEWILAPFGELRNDLCQIHRVGVSVW